MTPLKISLKNLLRRKGKSVFIVLAMVIGSGSFAAVKTYSDAMKISITHRLEKYGANIIITPGTDILDVPYNGMDMPVSIAADDISEKDFERIRFIKNYANIAAAGPSVTGITDAEGRRVLLTGIDFTKTDILRPWWEVNGNIPSDGEVIVGASAALVLGLKAGDNVKIKGKLFNVAGVLNSTGSSDDTVIFTDLKTAQKILKKEGRFSMVEVAALCSGCPIEDMVVQLQAVFPDADVKGIRQVINSRSEYLSEMESMTYGILVVLMIICGLVVTITMINNVRERSSEIGIFRAIGFTRIHLVKMIIAEARILSAIAGAAGYTLGYLAVMAWGAFSPGADGALIHFSGITLFLSLTITVITGAAAGIYPAFAASRLDPVTALRHI
jgi:putative ABC transport system permease protein